MIIDITKPIMALSVKQPWASLIASGQKSIETRTRMVNYRGPLLICASKIPDRNLKDQASVLPLGQAVCIVNLIDSRVMTIEDEQNACCEVYDRAKAWFLGKDRVTFTPFAVKGQLGLFKVDLPKDLMLRHHWERKRAR